MKKALLFLSVFALTVLTAVLLFALPAAADVVHSGKWGNLDWTLNETTGELVISGEGGVNNFFGANSTEAWRAHLIKIKSVTIGDGVTRIGEFAFSGCHKLVNIAIPNSVTSIGVGAFSRCSNLQNITIPNNVTSIGGLAFSDCYNLTSITIPSGVTSIEHSLFENCGLTSITIPDSVTSIGNMAFYACGNLSNITIPNNVTSIGDRVFSFCVSLTSITVFDGNPNYCSINGNLYSKDQKTLIQYAIGKSNTSFVIPNSVTSIGVDAFCYCKSLESITIPSSTTSIDKQAFYCCTNLSSIVIPHGVTSIGNMAFYKCTNLSSIIIPNTIKSIDEYSFTLCTSLTSAKYFGTQEQWDAVIVMDYNEPLINALQIMGELTPPSQDDNNPSVGEDESIQPDGENNPSIDGNDENETAQPDGDNDPSTDKNKTTNKSGCSSVVSGGLGMIALIALAGGMIVSKKKK